jgi:hypothetical protein
VNHVIAQIVHVKQKKNVKTVLRLANVMVNNVTAHKTKNYEKVKIKY